MHGLFPPIQRIQMLYDRAKTCSRDFPKKLTNVNTVPWNTDTVFSLTENCPSGIFFLHIFFKTSVSARQPEKSEAYCLWSYNVSPLNGQMKAERTLSTNKSLPCLSLLIFIGEKNNKLNFSLFLSVGIRKTKCCARLQIWTCAWDRWVIFAEMCWKMAPAILKL